MKLSISISTTAETNYVDGKTIRLNKEDDKVSPQNINLGLTGFMYKGSLQPLADLIMKWLKEKKKNGKV